jgi:hypothetical protein
MLKHIIWLQAVVETVTNETAKALNILAKQQTEICNTIYQNHLALDCLLASKGRVCGKFNLSNCCLHIDDEGKVIKEITDKIKKFARVPVQTWKGWSASDLFRVWFSTLGGFKTTFLVLGEFSILPCLIPPPTRRPVVFQVFQDHYESHYRKKDSSSYNGVWKYKPLDQDVAL